MLSHVDRLFLHLVLAFPDGTAVEGMDIPKVVFPKAPSENVASTGDRTSLSLSSSKCFVCLRRSLHSNSSMESADIAICSERLRPSYGQVTSFHLLSFPCSHDYVFVFNRLLEKAATSATYKL